MKKVNLKQSKAIHNLEVAKFLAASEIDSSDWVITISFYSVLHYVDYLIFPIKVEFEDGKIQDYASFESLYNLYKSRRPRHQSKHEFRHRLVETCLPEYINQYFDYLKTDCFQARYLEYPVDSETESHIGSANAILSTEKADVSGIKININNLNSF